MSAPSAVRRGLLARVHIASKELALAPESYQAILRRVTGKGSAADCTDKQLEAVIDDFRRLGWVPKTKRPTSKKAHVRLIYALWVDMRPLLASPTGAALRAFVERQSGVADPEWLDARRARPVIEGLKAWKARLEAEAEAKAGAA